MKTFPILYFEDNIVYNYEKEAFAVYKIQPFNYEFLSDSKKTNQLRQLKKLFYVVPEEGQIIGIPRSFSIEQHFEDLTNKVDGPTKDIFANHCKMTAAYLKSEGREAGDYQFYLIIKITKPSLEDFWKDFRGYLRSLIRDPIRLINEQAGVDTPEIFNHEIEAYMRIEDQLFNRVNIVMRVDRVSVKEVEWLIRRNFWRGVAETPIRKNWKPRKEIGEDSEGNLVVRPLRSEILTLSEGEVRLHPRHIEISQSLKTGEEKTAYQIFATVSQVPSDYSLLGSEFLYSIQDIGFPVEFLIKFNTVGHRETIKEVRKKKLEIKDQTNHTTSSGDDLPLELMDSNEQSLELEEELKKYRPPMVHTTITFCIAADSLEKANERVVTLKNHFDDMQFELQVPRGDQWKLFNEFLPGVPRLIKDYIHRLLPEYVAGSMFGATNFIGDNAGAYIGTTGVLNRPVYLDPSLAPKINKTASIAFLGTLGTGKSFLSNLVTYLAVTQGAKALIIDPKAERGNWIKDLPELKGMINVITLSSSAADTGKLDIFSICEDPKDASYVAVNLLCYLANTKNNRGSELAIIDAVSFVAKKPNPCMRAVIDRLHDTGKTNKEAHELYQLFNHYAALPYANLLFGTSKENAINIKTALNILQLQNISLPEPAKNRDDFNFDETISMAVMTAIVAFATKFTMQDRGVFKVINLDEAWAFTSSSIGKSLVEKLIRTGRAMNNAVYLPTQSAKDLLDESIKNNIGVKFVFKSDDAKEIANVLQFLNLEDNVKNQTIIRTLENGTALMQDLEGRVGVVSIDIVFDHIKKAFDTRPQSQGKKEREVS